MASQYVVIDLENDGLKERFNGITCSDLSHSPATGSTCSWTKKQVIIHRSSAAFSIIHEGATGNDLEGLRFFSATATSRTFLERYAAGKLTGFSLDLGESTE